MRRKAAVVAILAAVTVSSFIVGGCGQQKTVGDVISQISNNSPVSSPSDTEFTYGDKTVKYLRHEVTENRSGEKVLVVYYDFTNNSSDNAVFDYSFDDTCFQNGVEIEHSMWHVNDESRNSGKEIQKGVTITVASSFVLEDSTDDVTLEITPFAGERKLLTRTLTLE